MGGILRQTQRGLVCEHQPVENMRKKLLINSLNICTVLMMLVSCIMPPVGL